MSFGLKNAPSTFQSFMIKVLAGLLRKCCLDDTIIYSQTREEHLDHIALVMERL